MDPTGPYALVIGKFLQQAARGEVLNITGDGEQTRDFIHVDDVCTAIIAAATSDNVGQGDVFNVGAGKQTSVNALAALISTDTTHIAPRIEPKHALADISDTQDALYWKPIVALEEGIAELKKSVGVT